MASEQCKEGQTMDDLEIADDIEGGCGYEYDHDERITYEGADGTQYECRRCGAEWWEGRRCPLDDAGRQEIRDAVAVGARALLSRRSGDESPPPADDCRPR